MKYSQEKYRKLAYVASQYYLEGKNQNDIAKELGVSRPLISRMLTEARNAGIVEITVHEPGAKGAELLERLAQTTSVKGGILIDDGEEDRATNLALSKGAAQLLEKLKTKKLGIGWGHFIGELVNWLVENPNPDSCVTDVYPLVGNPSFPIRNYQSNENVRIMADNLKAKPHFLYLPAIPESMEEKKLLCSTELYRQMEKGWKGIDTALVNIGNYPSTPDFASVARYGDRLRKEKAVGRLLVYYFNSDGRIVDYSGDFAIQAPLDILEGCPNVIGVCSANTKVNALEGALKTGRLTHIVARTGLVKELYEEVK